MSLNYLFCITKIQLFVIVACIDIKILKLSFVYVALYFLARYLFKHIIKIKIEIWILIWPNLNLKLKLGFGRILNFWIL